MIDLLRVLVALAVVGLLGRATRPAWRHRALAVEVWRRIRPRHVVGSLALLVVVLGVAVTLMQLVPASRFGLGSLIGLSGNAVFAPVEQLAGGAGPSGGGATPGETTVAGGPGWVVLAAVTAFLGLLLVLFPWLAYVEENAFRAGLEHASLLVELRTALRFGLVHLVMLIPVAAALAIAVAGFAYGRVYRWTYEGELVRAPSRARTEALLASTVWHTAFNSTIVLLVLLTYVVDTVAGG